MTKKSRTGFELAPKLTTRAIPMNTHKKSSSVSARALYMTGVESIRWDLPPKLTTRAIPVIRIKKAPAFPLEPYIWQGWRDSNSQHADLESAALPIGATPLVFKKPSIAARVWNKWRSGRDSNPRPRRDRVIQQLNYRSAPLDFKSKCFLHFT